MGAIGGDVSIKVFSHSVLLVVYLRENFEYQYQSLNSYDQTRAREMTNSADNRVPRVIECGCVIVR